MRKTQSRHSNRLCPGRAATGYGTSCRRLKVFETFKSSRPAECWPFSFLIFRSSVICCHTSTKCYYVPHRIRYEAENTRHLSRQWRETTPFSLGCLTVRGYHTPSWGWVEQQGVSPIWTKVPHSTNETGRFLNGLDSIPHRTRKAIKNTKSSCPLQKRPPKTYTRGTTTWVSR